MSTKQSVAEMVKKMIEHTGLHKRPRIKQIIDHFANGQEHVKLQGRETKFHHQSLFHDSPGYLPYAGWEEQNE
jgi:hypothetical protein